MSRPISLSSIKFSNKEGELIIDDGCTLTFGNEEFAERYIQERYKYWKEVLMVDLVIAPEMGETMREIEVVKVFKLVARFYNILYRTMISKSRESELVEARRAAINICKERKVQDAVINRVLKVSHSVIIYHKNRFKELYKMEPKLARAYDKCEDYVNENMPES
jgi:chromosomal replication initiation ATPase DnaA